MAKPATSLLNAQFIKGLSEESELTHKQFNPVVVNNAFVASKAKLNS